MRLPDDGDIMKKKEIDLFGILFGLIGIIISSTVGSLLGAIILYYLGKILNKERLKKLVKNFVLRRFLHLLLIAPKAQALPLPNVPHRHF